MRADVIVVGVEQAGCSAAYHVARAGLEVLLLDQHESRQGRADGDALFPRAVAEVSLTILNKDGRKAGGIVA